ncbi:RNA polymerase sigma factor [Streptomyces sp. NPDC001450]
MTTLEGRELHSFLADFVGGDWTEPGEKIFDWDWDAMCPLADFEEFHKAHRKWLIMFVRRLVTSRGASVDAEDVVQDAFEVVFRKWDKVGRMLSPRGYLWRVTYNRAQRLMYKASREVANPMEAGFLELTGCALGWERSPQEMVMGDAVSQLLQSLPQRQAQVLLLTADGWTDSQIGKALDLSPATVRSHRRHLQKNCRQKVEQNLDAWSELLGPVVMRAAGRHAQAS